MTQPSRTFNSENWFGGFAFILLVTLLVSAQTTSAPNPAPSPSPSPAAQNNQAATLSPFPSIESTDPSPAEIARGTGLTFRGQNFPANAADIVVFLNGLEKGRVHIVDATTLVWTSPNDVDLGTYNVSVQYKKVPVALPSSALNIYSEAGKSQPTIKAIVPLVSYPEKEVYGFDVIGEGFSTRFSDNGLVVNQNEIPVCWKNDPDCQKCADDQSQAGGTTANTQKITSEAFIVEPAKVQCTAANENKAIGTVLNSQQLHFEWKIPKRYQGGANVQVRVGQIRSAPFQVTLSRVASIFPKLVSIGVLVALFGIVLWMLSSGFRRIIAGRRYTILSALFLDTETDTYSLSRLQFFIWTAVAILAYLYLLLSRSLVQGNLEFVDVPSGIPGIILVSAGTTVVAQVITRTKGPKGAGEIHPSLTDLVSTGGVIVPERFQFFVWTIIGAAVFVFLVFLNDPGTIKDLPQVPSGFLALMGVSSAGYLGGKAARSAGPVIDEIVARFSSLELAIKGRVLSRDASFRINDEDVASNLIEHLKPEIVEPDDEAQANTAKLLRVKILTPKPEWLKDGATLTIINPDGQKAAWKYDLGPAPTEPLQTSVVDTTVTLSVKGVNLSSETKVSIESPEGVASTETVTTKFQDPDTLEIATKNIKEGVLVLTNPNGRSTRTPFTVQ